MNAARVPLNFFGMPFGLAGLGVTWQTMAGYGRVPPAVGDIVLAAAAVASLAYFALDGGRVDTVAAFLGGYGLLMALAQVRLLPAYARLPFMPSTWAFTFSWAAVATTVTYWLNDIRPGGYRVGEYLVLAAVSALIGGIAIRTVLAAGRHQLMPRPVPARRDTELAGRNLS